MSRACLVLGAMFAIAARGAAPAYTAAGIVNVSNYVAGPFAPGSVIAIFGTDLARSARELVAADIRDNLLPTELNYTQVFVSDSPAPLFYVSPTQINFVVPSKQAVGQMKIRVAREGLSGPEIIVPVLDGAPGLFDIGTGYAIVTHLDNSLVVPAAPAHAGEIVVVYATGMGKTAPNPATGEIPQYAAAIVNLGALKVTLAGTPVDPGRVIYAGLTPTSAGLYPA